MNFKANIFHLINFLKHFYGYIFIIHINHIIHYSDCSDSPFCPKQRPSLASPTTNVSPFDLFDLTKHKNVSLVPKVA